MLYRDRTFIDRQGKVYTGDIYTDGGIITDISIKAEGGENPLLPPFVDIHMHGGYGIDVMNASAEEICYLSERLYNDNVGAYMPTTVAASRESILRAAGEIYKASEHKEYAEIVGIHIEGPFISEQYKGIMEEKYIVPCDISLYDDLKNICGDLLLRFTVAPECEGAEEFCRYVVSNGDLISIGHSGADAQKCSDLCRAGASSYIHIFNACSQLHHRNSSVAEAALSGNEFVELICDFVHVSETFVRFTEKLKSGRIILVTDAMQAASCEKGEYTFCGKTVYNDGTSVRDDTGRLAGSTLTMMKAYKNMSRAAGRKKALMYACENPAALLGLANYGYTDKGKRIIL